MPNRKRANASKSCLVSGSAMSAVVSSCGLATSPLYRVTIFLSTPHRKGRGGDAAFRRWVVLSDHEQRVLAELERCCAMEALEPDKPSRRVGRPGRPGSAAVLVLEQSASPC